MENLTHFELKNRLLDYLAIDDPHLKKDQENLTLTDLVDLIIGQHSDLLLQYAIIENAYFGQVPLKQFEEFQDAVLDKVNDIEEGLDTSEDFIEELGIKHGGIKQKDLN